MPPPQSERSKLLPPKPPPRVSPPTNTSQLTSLFERPSSTAQIRPERQSSTDSSFLVPVVDNLNDDVDNTPTSACTCSPSDIPGTIIGSLTFLLYHVVFCLAQAATITRPHAGHTSTGIMAKTAALGVLTAGPLFVSQVSINAIYPASDLFLAPFLGE